LVSSPESEAQREKLEMCLKKEKKMKSVLFAIMSLVMVSSMASTSYAAVEENPLSITTLPDGHNILANMDGLTVYTFDVDSGSISNCYDACAKAWPPVLATPDLVPAAPIGTTVRKDGSLQITYNGMPIYLFAGDGAPGEANGDGLGGVWHIIAE
jgi:predicted lipoprotein with Yx(FWY)xxD motif